MDIQRAQTIHCRTPLAAPVAIASVVSIALSRLTKLSLTARICLTGGAGLAAYHLTPLSKPNPQSSLPASNRSSPPPPHLPSPVMRRLANCLKLDDQLRLRLVSHEWKSQIDPLFSASIHPIGHKFTPQRLLLAIRDQPERVPFMLNCGIPLKGLTGLSGRVIHLPLNVAATHNPSLIPLLINSGANPLQADYQGNSALHCLGAGHTFDHIQPLCRAGFSLEWKNSHGHTPLHTAVLHKLPSVDALLASGSNPNAMTKQLETPLLYAAKHSPHLMEPLLKAGALAALPTHPQRATPLHELNPRSREDVLLLLRHGADPNARKTNGETPLHTAAGWSRECIDALIEGGAKVNLQDTFGETPLHKAASLYVRLQPGWNKPVPAIQALLDAYANPKIKNRRGETPSDILREANLHAPNLVRKKKSNPWKRFKH